MSPEGRAEVEATGRALAARAVAVDEIRHSGLARARESAAILARALAPPHGVHATTGLRPDDDPDVAAAELELAVAPLMLVGHLPHLARLTLALVGGSELERVRFDPGTAIGLRRGPEGWTLELVLPPRAGPGP